MNVKKQMQLLLRGTAGIMMAGCALTAMAVDNPVADPSAMVVSGNTRLTVLTPEMIRIEYSDKGAFEDKATFAIQNRRFHQVPRYDVREDDAFLYLDTDKLHLKYRKGTNPLTTPASAENMSITMPSVSGDSLTLWYPGKTDPLNLKGTTRTLDCSNGDNKRAEMEDGVVSRSGWAVINDSWSNTRPDGSRSYAMEPNEELGFPWWTERADRDALDLYFMGYGKDYKKAVRDFTRIAGKIPLPPAFAFGYWYSKYDAYSSDDFRNIMAALEQNDIPANVMIIDMDWHWNGEEACGSKDRGSWTGWSWNTNLIPDPEKLLSDMHRRNFHVALNLHPSTGINRVESPQYFAAMEADFGTKYNQDSDNMNWSLDYPDFTKSFFKHVIRDHEKEGVDFWWLDWQQYLTSPYTEALGETFWCNHVFFNEMKHSRPDRRPIIFHRWGGLGSHRYQIGFSGDTFINYPTLAFQPWFTSTAANVGYAYWGHDLGGHAIGDDIYLEFANDPELVLRWIQFGVFTPIFRTNATKDPRIERRMWTYENFPTMLEAVKLRYRLFPYIYTMARKTYENGLAICRPMYYEFPDDEEAYTYEGQYFYGDDIMVAPVTEASGDGKISSKKIWFPKGQWWDVAHNRMITGPTVATIDYTLSEIPYFYRAGAVIPNNPDGVKSVMDKPEEMVVNIVAGASGEGMLYEDRGDNADYETSFAVTLMRYDDENRTLTIDPRIGDQTGLPTTRAWTLKIHNVDAPKNPVNAENTEYDANKRLLTIKLPAAPVGKLVQKF